ncbi:MAG: (d)CMP kinase [Actinobacteria bacterium]|uniref:(d)CMP kinase n=1 Tax=freshwater metagenome TaxID=449393 RepID=A0A6J6CPF1_9ZZZZ|nr:(d)CMP kinase [Actinomycetota bacterium]
MTAFVVAVDGPAGSGKSSVCKEAARRLGFGYLDTGAGYRAMALHAKSHLHLDDAIASFEYEISLDPTNVQVKLAGESVTEDIRSDEVAKLVSAIAREQAVRNQQREDARARIASCDKPGIIVEGRDITTVVAPEAQVRILLTASEEVRLSRRQKDQTEVAENLVARDKSDSKVADFLVPAEGVALLDTTNLSFEESVLALMKEIEEVRNV